MHENVSTLDMIPDAVDPSRDGPQFRCAWNRQLFLKPLGTSQRAHTDQHDPCTNNLRHASSLTDSNWECHLSFCQESLYGLVVSEGSDG